MVCSERFVITNCDLIMFSIKRPMAAHVCMYDVVTRASDYGWQDTYVLTKAMGEMVIESMRDDLPTVIVRPSIVESSFRDPFPGWIEGNRYILCSLTYGFSWTYCNGSICFVFLEHTRMMDPLFTSYGKGQLPGFPMDPNCLVDVVSISSMLYSFTSPNLQNWNAI